MSRNMPTTWAAPPHTLAKLAILRKYLDAWFAIMGRKFPGKDLVYVDGFAGPGEYTNHADGSPVVALKAANSALYGSGSSWCAGAIRAFFVEQDTEKKENLDRRLEIVDLHPQVSYCTLHSSFESAYKDIRVKIGPQHRPQIFFIDPFGIKGVPFSVVLDILHHPLSEVVVNFDADGVVRLLKAVSNPNRSRILTDLFGCVHWETELPLQGTAVDLCRKAIDLYKKQLYLNLEKPYVYAFEMRSNRTTPDYYLVFAGRHPLGLQKMKEAMKSVDQTGEFQFADTGENQPILVRFNHPEDWANKLLKRFRGEIVSYQDIDYYALNETPFLNPKALLKVLEKQDMIEVITSNVSRRRGTFAERDIEGIKFKE